MTLDDMKPKPYQFSQKEMQDIATTLASPLMDAYLQSLEIDAMIAQNNVDLTDDTPNVSYRIVANQAFVQGQLQIIRIMRSMANQLRELEEAEKTTKQ